MFLAADHLQALPARLSSAGMVRMKFRGWGGGGPLDLHSMQVLTSRCEEFPGTACLFISDKSKEVYQDRERRPK